jgi:hypothetical protein
MNNDFDTINITDIVPSVYNPRKISNTEYDKLSKFSDDSWEYDLLKN